MFNAIFEAIRFGFYPINFLIILIGSIIGIILGAIPGLGSAMGMCLLLPFTYYMETTRGLILLVALYCGAVYGGSISAILLGIPGDAPAIATVFDGYPLAQKGEAGKALGTAIISSCLGGLFGTAVLILATPQLARVALAFGPFEYFSLALLGISAISSLSTGSQIKGIIAASSGLLISCIGVDPVTGLSRYDFGYNLLRGGVQFVAALIGLFAISEALSVAISKRNVDKKQFYKGKELSKLPPLKELLKCKVIMLKSAIIGTFIGALPGVGATIASLLGYTEAVRSSPHKEKFGTGIIEGIAAAETANNAAVGGAFIPLLSLGIPGSASTVIILCIFIMKGLYPGPLLFFQQPILANSVFISMIIANFMLIVCGLLAVRYFSKVLLIPREILVPFIVICCFIGAYAFRGNMGDVLVMFCCGIIGFIFKRYHYPVGAVVLGLVLGPIMETGLRKGLILYDGNIARIFLRPISATALFFAIVFFLKPFIKKGIFNRKKQDQQGEV